MTRVQNEEGAPYQVQIETSINGDAIISRALGILAFRLRKVGTLFGSPADVKNYCRLTLGDRPHEIFAVLFLDVQNRMVAFEEMFRGTLTQTSVYPREVVIRALHHRAAGVVFTHNHPSGSVNPSRADEALTYTLKAALALIDVRVLDHIIVSEADSLSMAEKGLV